MPRRHRPVDLRNQPAPDAAATDPLPARLGAAARRWRIAAGLTQVDVAAKLGITNVHLSNFERGKQVPSLGLVGRYREVFGVDLTGDGVGDDGTDLAAQLRGVKREARELRKYLKDLTTAVVAYIAAVDIEMEEPSTVERGRRIARLTNALELANDLARRFGLGLGSDGKSIRKGKAKS